MCIYQSQKSIQMIGTFLTIVLALLFYKFSIHATKQSLVIALRIVISLLLTLIDYLKNHLFCFFS